MNNSIDDVIHPDNQYRAVVIAIQILHWAQTKKDAGEILAFAMKILLTSDPWPHSLLDSGWPKKTMPDPATLRRPEKEPEPPAAVPTSYQVPESGEAAVTDGDG